MGYWVECGNKECRRNKKGTWAVNIVDLVNNHTGPEGRFICSHCGGNDTFIYRHSELQEKGEVWERWIKGVIRIDSGIKTYSPYVFLTADSENEQPNGLHFNYYKDTRHQKNGRLKHGHGPGGAPVLGTNDIFTIMKHLVSMKLVTKDRLVKFAEKL